ncbi:MAG: O-antigen ligase, partial [Lentisphaeria bacterium]
NLGGLSHQRILFLALLLPLLLFERREPSFSKFNAIDKAVVFYVFWVIVCNFRIENYTAMFRTDLWEVIDVFVPYLAIRYFTKNYALVLTAVSFALLSQSLAGIVESVMHWHLYSDLERFGHFANQLHPGYKFRNGFLRAQTSFMNPLIYALFSNMSFCCSVIFLSKIGSIAKENYSKKFAWAGFLISTLGTMASGSRAGMAGSVLIVIVSMILLWAIKRSRDPKQLLITSFVCCIALVVLFGQDFLNENFDYRMRLLKIGSGVVMDSPLFGHMDARSHPAMQELIQGEGIVDVVNSYLAIALSYGLPALILFVFAVLSCLSKLYDCLRLGNDDLLAFGIFAFASIFILAFNLITTSASHWTGQWMWIALAIGSNIIARAKDEEPLTIAKRQ